jgi:hypothetical protein
MFPALQLMTNGAVHPSHPRFAGLGNGITIPAPGSPIATSPGAQSGQQSLSAGSQQTSQAGCWVFPKSLSDFVVMAPWSMGGMAVGAVTGLLFGKILWGAMLGLVGGSVLVMSPLANKGNPVCAPSGSGTST